MKLWCFIKRAMIGLLIGTIWLAAICVGAYFCKWNPVCSGAAKNTITCVAAADLFVVPVLIMGEVLVEFFPFLKNSLGLSIIAFFLCWMMTVMFMGWVLDRVRGR